MRYNLGMPRRSADSPSSPNATRPSDAIAEELRLLFGSNFREARLKAGLLQKDVQARTAIRQHYISELENGLHNPTLTTMAALAHAVGTDVRALLKLPRRRRG